MSAHGGMLGAVTEAAEIQAQTGCTVEESFTFQRNIADFREDLALASAERALIPLDRLH